MVLVTSVRDYINRMLQDISGMKVLILDSETVSNVSIVYSQSELLQKEVFLVEMIDSISVSKESMSHLKAVYFIRPTSENVQKLRYQLANPRFGEHHLFFSNMLKDTQIHILADSDEHEAVQQVQEFYADFVAGDPYHLTLNMASNHLYMLPAVVDPSGLQRYSDRVVDGIAAVFLALKRRPVIRYQRTSDTAKRIAHETAAMVHELIGLQDNKVDLRSIGSLPKDQQVVIILQYQEMARFVDNYPEYKKMQGNVSKHATLVTEMSKLVEARRLMLVSQTEQDLACNGGQGAAYEAVTDLLNNESVSDIDRLRLVMLYALRYEKENLVQLMQLFNKLASRSPKYKPGWIMICSSATTILVSSSLVQGAAVQFLLKQTGVEKRTGDLFGNRDLINIARNMARGLKGVEMDSIIRWRL
uniref:Sec1 family protein n=1 Tax=Brassica oleracea var. oleracea TaxID=109376 RepID=A0A0D3CW58_BRAOL